MTLNSQKKKIKINSDYFPHRGVFNTHHWTPAVGKCQKGLINALDSSFFFFFGSWV